MSSSGKRLFVCITCGVSLLQNLIEHVRELGDEHVLERLSREVEVDFKSCSVREILAKLTFCEKLRRASKSSYMFSLALMLLKENPVRFSAELNTLVKLISKLRGRYGSLSEVVCQLIVSDTASGYFCGRAIEHYLAEVKSICDVPVQVDSLVIVKGLLDNPDRISEALNIIADKVALKMFRYERAGYELYTIISGGLKIEVVYISIIASLARSRVVYCPDPRSDIVILPPLPVVLEEKLINHVLGIEPVDEDSANRYIELGLAERRDGKLIFRRWVETLVKARTGLVESG